MICYKWVTFSGKHKEIFIRTNNNATVTCESIHFLDNKILKVKYFSIVFTFLDIPDQKVILTKYSKQNTFNIYML